jgi:uncharacterized membrane protein YozB (DUF420 family)
VIDIRILPTVNALLNTTSAVLLALGFWHIKRGRVSAHWKCMIGALATSTVFLASYLYYHAHAGITRYQETGLIRTIYLSILASHTVLAGLVPFLVVVILTFAARRRFERHAAWARWTWPVWMYVSITGVVIYLMLYHRLGV